jgi:hypothetical protein
MRESENNESEILRSWNTMNNLNSNEIKNENMFWDSNKFIKGSVRTGPDGLFEHAQLTVRIRMAM